MLGFKGPSQGKSTLGIFRFGYRKASNDKKVPDRVGSEDSLGSFVRLADHFFHLLSDLRSRRSQNFQERKHGGIVGRLAPHNAQGNLGRLWND
jgi:hypothetical protein